MYRKRSNAPVTLALGMAAALAIVGCDDADLSGGFGFDEFGFGADSAWVDGGGDYYYGFYDQQGSGSFSLYPGSDPGDSLETYLGNSVIY